MATKVIRVPPSTRSRDRDEGRHQGAAAGPNAVQILADAGLSGKRGGEGFYRYAGKTRVPNPRVPELLAVAASASAAAHTWSATGITAGSEQQIAAVPPIVSAADTAAVTVTFDDASTVLSGPTSSQTEDLGGLVTAAVHGWQGAAEQAVQRAAPASDDLLRAEIVAD